MVCLVQGRDQRGIGVRGFCSHELGIVNDKITSIVVVVKPASKVTKFRPIIVAAAWDAELDKASGEVPDTNSERVTGQFS